MELQDDHRE